ncbi:Carbonic anhydrase or acetyltransferase, isoleucine patch superfamily [Polynucleobacter meluiroseus]|uniref:Carbonic anhydrase or acetyltransferase, isoleucine patch superfamily n=1 Tax=Polynucleobacter meluiroseus TaxID=1938814 RepID=A0A240DY93_9BURK|nr:gamma carbonic anhydrase family protein [Polynucleobacter meluiroseus]SNX27902.1 Carbonic anhydrase or acetyltransferase, isoleucine patch superfamily [Polynucleobacter meluiroseus]
MATYELDGVAPQIGSGVWIADSAEVIGRVELRDSVSVWPKVVIRGDNDLIQIGEGSNVQDASILHADPGYPLLIGKRVTVGHQVVLHGCQIGDDSLIGIGAVILNGAKIGQHCLVGAGSLVTEGKEFPDGSMILGSPARVVKMLSPEQIAGLQDIAGKYVLNAKRYQKTFKQIA